MSKQFFIQPRASSTCHLQVNPFYVVGVLTLLFFSPDILLYFSFLFSLFPFSFNFIIPILSLFTKPHFLTVKLKLSHFKTRCHLYLQRIQQDQYEKKKLWIGREVKSVNLFFFFF